LRKALSDFQRACKPGSVSRRNGTSIIYLDLPSPVSSSSLPLSTIPQTWKTRTGNSVPDLSGLEIYMALQPMRRTAPDITARTGGLLPRLFTLIPTNRDGYFLLHCYTLSDIFPLGSMAPFVARTFLSTRITRQSDRTARIFVFRFSMLDFRKSVFFKYLFKFNFFVCTT